MLQAATLGFSKTETDSRYQLLKTNPLHRAIPTTQFEAQVDISSFAGELVSILAELGTRLGVKTKRQVSVYLQSVSYKKPKKFVVASGVVKMSAGPLVLTDMLTDSNKPVRL
ncbi:hypothetical protein G9A89_023946 [Geosiphon pyriformis]|nr:hypothetical protein G9A89_023946 [Geosiphon pyriformis]